MSATRVVHSTREWLPQTQAWLYNQVVSLPQRVSSHVLCQRTRNLDQYGLPRIHPLPGGALAQFRDKIERQLHRPRPNYFWRSLPATERPHVVHSHFGPTGWNDAPWVTERKLPHVVSFYGYDVGLLPRRHPRWNRRYCELFEAVTLVLCEGPFMAGSIMDLGCPAEKLRVHRLGIMTDAIPFQPRRWSRAEPLKVLIAAGFRPKKGITYGLAALGRLRQEHPVEITVIGDSDGSRIGNAEKRRILAAVERAGLTDVVQLRGFRPYAEVLAEAMAHHVYLAPSVSAADGDSEGGVPVALIEMAASGMPVVSTRHCDIPEVVREADGGLLADERDAQGLYERLRWLTEHPDEWEVMTAACRRHIEARYDARKQGEALAGLYDAALTS